ncbi:efflux RND transporter permease subunit [Agaribacter flavus]|uniref:Efflux RND transporter permease subunit n=1 Tax=Agaribacter flavus TaxID=1902781 RepID=A0ABV7FPI2_9ALTE
MSLVKKGIDNPVSVIVGLLLVTLFGALSLIRLPIQMTPNVEQAQIIISNNWPSASPEEIEAEITEPQEDALRGISGLQKMESSSGRNFGQVVLSFDQSIDLQDALVETMNQLNRVPSYPADAQEPVLFVGRDEFSGIIAWFNVQTINGNTRQISSYGEFIEDIIESRLERIDGISSVNTYGTLEKELRISFNPDKLAAYKLGINQLANELRSLKDTSGGFTEIGRRQYTLRFQGKIPVENLGSTAIGMHEGHPILLSDVASIDYQYEDELGVIYQLGERGVAISVIPEANENILELMQDIQQEVTALNQGVLKQNDLLMTQVYNETTYIDSAIDLLRNNIAMGVLLAIGILWWFLRRLRATLIVAITIPVAMASTFVVLDAMGKTLNIISLAGIAFAVGMVLDSAIVVLENIVRLRSQGLCAKEAATKGVTQVSGALLASTATTIAIFIPILFIEDISGQLFGDLALAISVAVVSSFLVAMLVLPSSSVWLLKNEGSADPHLHQWQAISKVIMAITAKRRYRIAWVLGLATASVAIVWLIFPKVDYLPQGNRNDIFAFISPPPSISVEIADKEIAQVINEKLRPYYNGEKQPKVESYFVGVFSAFGFAGMSAEDPKEVKALLAILREELKDDFPDSFTFASQQPLFNRINTAGALSIDIQGIDIAELQVAARLAMAAIQDALPSAQVQAVPELEFSESELRLIPKLTQLQSFGISRQDVAGITAALGDGQFLGEYFDGQRRARIMLRAEDWQSPEQLLATPIYANDDSVIPLGELVDFKRTASPRSIRRVDRMRTLSLNISPPEDLSLEETLSILKTEVEPIIYQKLSDNSIVNYRGSAEALEKTIKEMSASFFLALVILFLLMAAMFRSFLDSALVVLTIPLATVGGISLLQISNLVVMQALDLLTMIGFVILLGLVVNNAILLVLQTRESERKGLSRTQAVETAITLRLRPILMSTLTSLFGMLPLWLLPGSGAEIYRGTAAVIVGGMTVSTLFMLVFLPSLLRFGEDNLKK